MRTFIRVGAVALLVILVAVVYMATTGGHSASSWFFYDHHEPMNIRLDFATVRASVKGRGVDIEVVGAAPNCAPSCGERRHRTRPAKKVSPPAPIKPVVAPAATGSYLKIDAQGEAATILAKKLTDGEQVEPCCPETAPEVSTPCCPTPAVAPTDMPARDERQTPPPPQNRGRCDGQPCYQR